MREATAARALALWGMIFRFARYSMTRKKGNGHPFLRLGGNQIEPGVHIELPATANSALKFKPRFFQRHLAPVKLAKADVTTSSQLGHLASDRNRLRSPKAPAITRSVAVTW